MSIEEIRSFRNAQPFRPFTLLLRDGRLLRVALPLRIALDPKGRSVAIFDGPHFNFVRLEEIRLASAEESTAPSHS